MPELPARYVCLAFKVKYFDKIWRATYAILQVTMHGADAVKPAVLGFTCNAREYRRASQLIELADEMGSVEV